MQKILHFHIPKTGGIAIRQYFIDQLGEKRVSPSVVGSRLTDALVHWGDLDVVSGHFLLYQGDQLPQDRCCVTVLRDPIDRFLSEYFFSKSDNADRLLDTRVHALDLDAYLESLSVPELDVISSQIEMLYPLGTSSQASLSADEKLAASLRALERFEFIGLQNELEDFASMLDAKFSWQRGALTFQNVTSRRAKTNELSTQQQRKLKALFEREFELYHHAQEHFKNHRRSFIKCAIRPQEQENDRHDGPSQNPMPADPLQVDAPANFGDMRCVIESVTIDGEISGSSRVMVGEQMVVSIKFRANEPIDELNVGIAIKDRRGQLVFGTNSMLLGDVYSLQSGEYVMRFSMLNRAPNGRYTIDAALVRSERHYEGCYHWLEKASAFEVHEKATMHFEGHILMDANVELASASPDAAWTHTPYAATNHRVRSLGRVNPPLTQFGCRITPMSCVEHFYAGMDVFVPMRVENISNETWAAYGQQLVTLTYRWLSENNEVVVADGMRSRLPSDISAGSAVIIPLRVQAPNEHGNFQLVVSLVQEAVAWFVEKDPESAHIMHVNVS